MQTVVLFFQQYAAAYVNADVASFEQLVSLPCMLLSGDSKTILIDSGSLSEHVLSQVEKYRQLGVVHADFVLQHQLRLSDQLQFASLYWRFYDSTNQIVFTCHTSYTLQWQQGRWQLVALILDDEVAAYNRAAAR